MSVERRVAKIESTNLGYEDHGIFTAYLHVSYGGGLHQGIGGYALDSPADRDAGEKHRKGTAVGHDWIIGVMRACGVECWEQLPGRTVYVLVDELQDRAHGKVVGLEPLPTERGERFDFREWAANEAVK